MWRFSLPSIADSSAVREAGRVLPQHQAALTLLQGLIGDPRLQRLRWLDLACGRGQIISCLRDNLSASAREKITYYGYDISDRYTQETSQTATGLGLGGQAFKVGDISDFPKLVPDGFFEFVTLTNAVHEVPPEMLSAVLVESIVRLSPMGTLFVYDMESLSPPELGAIPWLREEVAAILVAATTALGADAYEPQTGRWPHRTCNAWNAQVCRAHLAVDQAVLAANRDSAVAQTSGVVIKLLTRKLEDVRKALEALTRFGAETPEEILNKERYLYEFWSITRALRAL